MASPSEKTVNGNYPALSGRQATSSPGATGVNEGVNGRTNGHETTGDAMTPSVESNLSVSSSQTGAASQGYVPEQIPSIQFESSQAEQDEQGQLSEDDLNSKKKDLYVGNLYALPSSLILDIRVFNHIC
jgi:hypothetical protein